MRAGWLQVNLAVLRTAVEEAAGAGAELVLLPEDGIHGYGFTRETVRPFLEFLPARADWSRPCFEASHSHIHGPHRRSSQP